MKEQCLSIGRISYKRLEKTSENSLKEEAGKLSFRMIVKQEKERKVMMGTQSSVEVLVKLLHQTLNFQQMKSRALVILKMKMMMIQKKDYPGKS